MPIRPNSAPSRALAAATARSLARLGALRAVLALGGATVIAGAALAEIDLGRPLRLSTDVLLASQTLLLHAAAWLLVFQVDRDDRQGGLTSLTAALGPSAHLAGRFGGVTLVLLACLAGLLLLDAALLTAVAGAPPLAPLAQLALAGLSAILAAALALLLMQALGPVAGLLLAVLAWAVGHGLDEALILARERGGAPLRLLTESAYRLLPNFSLFDRTGAAGPLADPWPWLFPLPYALGYAALLVGVAGLLAGRRPWPPG